MPYPDNFNGRAFDAHHGNDAIDRAELAAEVAASEIMAQNRAILIVLQNGLAELTKIGKPEIFTANGCDFEDILEMLREAQPDVSNTAEDQVFGRLAVVHAGFEVVHGTKKATPDLWPLLDTAHSALRMVDASDQMEPQTDATCVAVMRAVLDVEEAARKAGHVFPEFRTLERPMRVGGRMQRYADTDERDLDGLDSDGDH